MTPLRFGCWREATDRSSGRNQPVVVSCPPRRVDACTIVQHGLDAVGHAELGEDVVDVGLHGLLREEELRRDLGVAASRGHQAQHLALSRREVGGGRTAVAAAQIERLPQRPELSRRAVLSGPLEELLRRPSTGRAARTRRRSASAGGASPELMSSHEERDGLCAVGERVDEGGSPARPAHRRRAPSSPAAATARTPGRGSRCGPARAGREGSGAALQRRRRHRRDASPGRPGRRCTGSR